MLEICNFPGINLHTKFRLTCDLVWYIQQDNRIASNDVLLIFIISWHICSFELGSHFIIALLQRTWELGDR